MLRIRCAALAVAVVAVAGAFARPRAIATATPPVVNHPPVVTSSLPPHATFSAAAPIRFTVTVTDPDGDAVFARVVSGPRETGFAPIVNAPSGVTREVVVYPESLWQGRVDIGPQRLVVETWDARQPWRKTLTKLRFRVLGQRGCHGLRMLQLDQDPAPEIVARAPLADAGGVVDAGAYATLDYPFAGRQFDAAPGVWSAASPETLGLYETTEQIGDVNGDGLDDVVALHARKELAVWFGTTARGARAADMTLRSNDADLGRYFTPSFLVDDVTGDGIDDVVMGCPWVDTTAKDAGEVLVFVGGPAIGRTTVALRVPNAHYGDGLGAASNNPTLDPFRVGDVNGDGVDDLIVIAPYQQLSVGNQVGSIYVWSGATLTGSPAPTATLTTTGSPQAQFLGLCETFDATFLVDVTGDGVLDVVAATPDTLPEGAIFVWQGGSGIAGTVDPTATLVPSPGGFSSSGGSELPDANGIVAGLQFADLDLDGITDIVAARQRADVGTVGVAGAILVFAGGSLSGTLTETALLRRANPQPYDLLTWTTMGMQLVDVTGDGAPDVVCGSIADSGSASPGGGGIDVFEARKGLTGTVTPSASLLVPGTSIGLTNTGLYHVGVGMLVEEVTGDGIPDVIGSAAYADQSPLPGQGAVYVWAGGSNLTSGTTVLPTATLQDTNSRTGFMLGERNDFGPAVHFVDWDGDGIKDLVTNERQSSKTRLITTGRAFVWLGGATLAGTPAPFAIAPSTQVDDQFCGDIDYNNSFPNSLWFHDVTGDGVVDLLVGAGDYDTSLGHEAGAFYVFAGGAAAAGTLAPLAMLEDFRGRAGDHFSGSSELCFADLDSDGFDEVIASAPDAQGTGRIVVFRGPITGTTNGRVLLTPALGDAPGLGR